jgi:hypothetical protein
VLERYLFFPFLQFLCHFFLFQEGNLSSCFFTIYRCFFTCLGINYDRRDTTSISVSFLKVIPLKINDLNSNILFRGLAVSLSLFAASAVSAQMITGVWKGKINRQKVEVKIIQNGDSLTGTSYYYESPTHYRRYSIKGFFDPETNEAVWWDDLLIEEKAGRTASSPGRVPLLSRADFNCPGDGRMMLDGKTGTPEDQDPRGDLHLDKTETGSFTDEWDFILDNYLIGANDPWIIDSVTAIAYEQPVQQPDEPVAIQRPTIEPPVKREEPAPVKKPVAPPIVKADKPAPQQTIEEKFTARKKVFVTEIPVDTDSLELRFYDNAEIDGDSISLFLNDKLIFQHIRLLGSAYTIKLAKTDLNDTNELIMVAENLGTIPPNTSFMIAMVGEKRYEARLASTEGSSAMIRLIKK